MIGKDTRPSWDEYFMNVALLIAKRGNCDRLAVGAVITKDNQILATGYNGAIHGLPTCLEAGHLIVHNHCLRTIHAEQNALIQIARSPLSSVNATIYVTHFPCLLCTKLILQAGIKRIVYLHDYFNDPIALELIKQAEIELEKIHLEKNLVRES